MKPEPHTGGWQIQWKLQRQTATQLYGHADLDWKEIEHESWDSEDAANERLKYWQGLSFSHLLDYRVAKI